LPLSGVPLFASLSASHGHWQSLVVYRDLMMITLWI